MSTGNSNSGEGGICGPGTYCEEGSEEERDCDIGFYNVAEKRSQCDVSYHS